MSVNTSVEDPQLRVTEADAQTALRLIAGQPAVAARARLRFGPGRTCEPVARLLDRALVQAEGAGLDPALLVVAEGSAQRADDIVRVRRTHGTADWITTPTCHVRIILRPAGLPAATADPLPRPDEDRTRQHTTDKELTGPVHEALSDVIDPDLGVNIVDLGFVRGVEIRDQTAVITMTLTSAACPLSRLVEDQIRTALTGLAGLDEFLIDWEWVPAWRPADITDSGREQLRAIGFSF